ncbi:MAG: NAD(P)-binding domain-containing protein [bacterium]|nr:NAD(P)-binding domain-containing protein [bacterium]
MLETLIWVAAGAITVLIPTIYLLVASRKSRAAQAILTQATESGLDQPVSIHPHIDPNICIGSGACVRACPEKDVLGLIDNRGVLINPAHCIGHGLCQAACPVDAITLVFGTVKRGVDIPHIKGNFETNVPGIFIAGELGGMGLIANAVRQGVEAATYINQSLESRSKNGGILDLAIVGAGPAGIAASLQAKKDGLKFMTFDQEDLGGTILTYPRRKLVMTAPMDLPIYGKVKLREIQKESLLELFQEVFTKTGLSISAKNKVEDIVREDGHFKLTTKEGEYSARRILLAIGRRGSPRKLGVPGEISPKVAYRVLDPEKFAGLKILVVGGGDSAVEAAVALSEQPGTSVHLSYRQDKIFRIKEGNRRRLDESVASRRIIPLLPSEVVRIEPDTAIMRFNDSELALTIDYIFIFAGGELPTEFLQKIGIEFTRKFGEA